MIDILPGFVNFVNAQIFCRNDGLKAGIIPKRVVTRDAVAAQLLAERRSRIRNENGDLHRIRPVFAEKADRALNRRPAIVRQAEHQMRVAANSGGFRGLNHRAEILQPLLRAPLADRRKRLFVRRFQAVIDFAAARVMHQPQQVRVHQIIAGFAEPDERQLFPNHALKNRLAMRAVQCQQLIAEHDEPHAEFPHQSSQIGQHQFRRTIQNLFAEAERIRAILARIRAAARREHRRVAHQFVKRIRGFVLREIEQFVCRKIHEIQIGHAARGFRPGDAVRAPIKCACRGVVAGQYRLRDRCGDEFFILHNHRVSRPLSQNPGVKHFGNRAEQRDGHRQPRFDRFQQREIVFERRQADRCDDDFRRIGLQSGDKGVKIKAFAALQILIRHRRAALFNQPRHVQRLQLRHVEILLVMPRILPLRGQRSAIAARPIPKDIQARRTRQIHDQHVSHNVFEKQRRTHFSAFSASLRSNYQ